MLLEVHLLEWPQLVGSCQRLVVEDFVSDKIKCKHTARPFAVIGPSNLWCEKCGAVQQALNGKQPTDGEWSIPTMFKPMFDVIQEVAFNHSCQNPDGCPKCDKAREIIQKIAMDL
jgi:hypothetical protein